MVSNTIFFSILTAVFCHFTFGTTATKYYENQFCQPRPSVVETHPYRYPFFVSLHRCDGSCLLSPPSLMKCVPAAQEDITFTTYDVQNRKKISVVMKNHTKCQPACVAKESECASPNVFKDCRCQCPHRLPPENIKCETTKSWNRYKCKCMCNKVTNCPSRRYFDEDSCSCKCKPERKLRCEKEGGIFKTENCGCRRRKQRTGRNEEENFGLAQPFWICMIFAEFIIFLLIFEAVLFYKNQGFVYHISKSCYSKFYGGNLRKFQKQTPRTKIGKTNSISTDNMIASMNDIAN